MRNKYQIGNAPQPVNCCAAEVPNDDQAVDEPVDRQNMMELDDDFVSRSLISFVEKTGFNPKVNRAAQKAPQAKDEFSLAENERTAQRSRRDRRDR